MIIFRKFVELTLNQKLLRDSAILKSNCEAKSKSKNKLLSKFKREWERIFKTQFITQINKGES